MTNINSAAAAAGRFLMSIIFLLAGVQKLGEFSGTVAYMASQGLLASEFAAVVAILVECIGGLLVLIGYQPRVVGLVLALWCAVTGLIAHTRFTDPNQMVHFLKNLAMCGGFLQLFAFGAGRWSVDAHAGYAVRRA